MDGKTKVHVSRATHVRGLRRFASRWCRAAIVVLALTAVSCSSPPSDPDGTPSEHLPPASEVPFKRGIGFWPTDYSKPYLDRCFELLKQGSDLVVIQRDLFPTNENRQQLAVFDQWLDRGAKANLERYIALEPFDGDRSAVRRPEGLQGPAPRLSDPKCVQAYRDEVLRIVRRHTPEYINVAVEVNMYRRRQPGDYRNFPPLFRSLRAEIRRISPRTKVFVSYQYEVLLGTFPGLTGAPQWDLFGADALDQDVVGISSYPMFLRSPYRPDAVPVDYYQPLKTRAKKPLFFAELGWYSGASVSPASSPRSQEQLISRVPALLAGLDVEALCWVCLADLKDLPALKELKRVLPQFFTLGLVSDRLEPKPSWRRWLSMKAGASQAVSAPATEPAAGHIELDGVLGLGSTQSASVQSGVAGAPGGRAVVWSYRISTDPLAMLLKQGVRVPRTATGLKVLLRSENEATLAILLEESGGARYEKRVTVSGGKWQEFDLPWSAFQLQKESKDSNARLDHDRVSKLILIDISGFMGQKGTNRVWVSRVALSASGSK